MVELEALHDSAIPVRSILGRWQTIFICDEPEYDLRKEIPPAEG